MPRLSKKLRQEMTFFINPKTKKRKYNSLCKSCVDDCKQSYRASIVICPRICKSCRRSKGAK